MSVESGGDTFTLRADDALGETTGTQERDGDAGGTSAPAQDQNDHLTDDHHNDDCTQNQTAKRLSCNDQRTDLRAVDRHASWREVAAACHVRPGR